MNYTPEQIRDIGIKTALAVKNLGDSLNRLTENTPVNELVKSFSEMNVLDLAEAAQYYHEREMYNTCAAIKIVVDKKATELLE